MNIYPNAYFQKVEDITIDFLKKNWYNKYTNFLLYWGISNEI